jgi:hypothetical protein
MDLVMNLENWEMINWHPQEEKILGKKKIN